MIINRAICLEVEGLREFWDRNRMWTVFEETKKEGIEEGIKEGIVKDKAQEYFDLYGKIMA